MDKVTTMPSGLRSFGRVHIVGIGGIGMSGIAEVMHVMGYEVQGSDLGDNANTQRLRDMGIDVAVSCGRKCCGRRCRHRLLCRAGR